jgi:class 3 adenylate cyclase
MIVDVLTKTSHLLFLSFGEAGASIIRHNLRRGKDIDPLLPGVKVFAVFGFCDIRQFTDATECLQEEVMVFVNSVAAIVHEICSKHRGAANKNIGDAFLIAWKVSADGQDYPQKSKTTRSSTDSFAAFQSKRRNSDLRQLNELHNDERARKQCTNALVAFVKVAEAIKESNSDREGLGRYCDHSRIKARFGAKTFRVNMGYGLHIGWSIEGAIGSKHKIDASYLSPNVNMASR